MVWSPEARAAAAASRKAAATNRVNAPVHKGQSGGIPHDMHASAAHASAASNAAWHATSAANKSSGGSGTASAHRAAAEAHEHAAKTIRAAGRPSYEAEGHLAQARAHEEAQGIAEVHAQFHGPRSGVSNDMSVPEHMRRAILNGRR